MMTYIFIKDFMLSRARYEKKNTKLTKVEFLTTISVSAIAESYRKKTIKQASKL